MILITKDQGTSTSHLNPKKELLPPSFAVMSIGDFSIELYEYQKKIIGDKQMFFRGFKMLVVIRRQATYTNKRIGERQTTCLSILITNLDINTLQ